jgi:hypothetical protein
VPLTNRRDGEDPDVISFAANRYAERYGRIWDEFVEIIGGGSLPTIPGFGARLVPTRSAGRVAPKSSRGSIAPEVGGPRIAGEARVRYSATRLLFRRREIEPLGLDECFEVATPAALFRFTKREFYEEFPGVVQSRSYLFGGVYHYPTVPKRAERFRVG